MCHVISDGSLSYRSHIAAARRHGSARQEDEDLLLEIEQSYGARLSFRADPIYHVENFKIIDIESGQEQR